jgi:pyruvate kinase
MTDKDRSDDLVTLSLGVDFLALSFVRTRSDLDALRTLVNSHEADAGLIAKIERPEALEHIDATLEATDDIMVARGDLGVELLPEQVPAIQQQLLVRARLHRRPVIVALQMLKSMTENVRPTRAEVTDVLQSVVVGADAVMLSAEAAVGSYPIEVGQMMDRIARQAEAHLWRHEAFGTLAEEMHEQADGGIDLGDAVPRHGHPFTRAQNSRGSRFFAIRHIGDHHEFRAARRAHYGGIESG